MSREQGVHSRAAIACVTLGCLLVLSGCASDDYGTSSSVSVGYGYGGYYGPYYGPGYYGPGYYPPYPPVIIDPPDNRPERPDRPNGGEHPTTLPADLGGPSTRPTTRPSTAPSRPPSASRPTSRPSPRPAPRPMPRGRR